jgi:hypothetical protein
VRLLVGRYGDLCRSCMVVRRRSSTVEQSICNRQVAGSSPVGGSNWRTMPNLKCLQFLYGMIGVVSTLVAAASGIGLLFSISIWDIESSMVCGLFFGFFTFLACLMARLMEE